MKNKTVWLCRECGADFHKWSGQCIHCKAWNSLEEMRIAKDQSRPVISSKKDVIAVRLNEIQNQKTLRFTAGIAEFDKAIGGGIVAGSLTLLGGEPGIGKSTLSLQLAHAMAKHGPVLYVCGEESLEQVSIRARRLGIETSNILFLSELEVNTIIEYVQKNPPIFLIIDSIQIVFRSDIPSSPGSATQLREAAHTFMQLAKSYNIATILIGHVTKSGEIAGPKLLEHLVDTVLYFEGDNQQNVRLLRVIKNRFGPTDEIAVFEMKETGLQEVLNPSKMFLEDRSRGSIGSVIIPTLEGTRPLLIEAQALVTKSFFPSPSRKATGIDINRLALLLAVLEKRARFRLYQFDVFVSITGGLKVLEPAIDLGVLLAITSSLTNVHFDPDTLVIGEVGLGGEIRAVSHIESRLKEGIQLGFSHAIIPQRNTEKISKNIRDKIDIRGVSWIDEAIPKSS